MKTLMAGIAFTGLIALSSQVLADDSTAMAQKQSAMKDCMARQKAKDSSTTEMDMTAACKKELDMKKSGNDLTSAPPVPPPPSN
jgi:hypothetical protein